MAVRWARVEDAQGLFRLNEAFNDPGANTVEGIEDSLRENARESVAVAECDGQLVGFCCGQRFWSMCYRDECAEITELYVEEAYRRKGIARALIGFLEQGYARQGIVEVHLLTGEGNHRAQALYRAMGYERVGEVMYRKGLGG